MLVISFIVFENVYFSLTKCSASDTTMKKSNLNQKKKKKKV